MAEIAFRLRVLGWLFTIGIAVSGLAEAERNPLLPHPQEIAYGSGTVSLRGLKIQLPRDATAEDWFVAQTMSDCLSRQTRTPIPIVSGEAASHVIRLHRTGPLAALPAPGEKAGAESREAYSLAVRPNQVDLEARSTAGLFYGAETACQLVEGPGEEAELPIAEIHDWPMLAYRGVMVDMSHGPLPTEEEVKRQLDFLARWKANQYYFYSEASIELEAYPLLNPEGLCSAKASSLRPLPAFHAAIFSSLYSWCRPARTALATTR
jgi:hexosaminidase